MGSPSRLVYGLPEESVERRFVESTHLVLLPRSRQWQRAEMESTPGIGLQPAITGISVHPISETGR